MTTLQVTIHAVRDLKRGHNIFDKLDPFVVILVGEEEQKTSVMDGAGRRTLIGECRSFEWDGEAPVTLTVWDRDKGLFRDDDELGKVYVDRDCTANEHWHGWLQLKKDDDHAGEILVTFLRWE